jgi:hypothetical protein
MSTFFMLLWLACTVMMVVWLVQGFRKKGPKRKALYAFLAGVGALIGFSVTAPPSNTQQAAAPTPDLAVVREPAAPEPTPPSTAERLTNFTQGCTDQLVGLYPSFVKNRESVSVTFPAALKNNLLTMQLKSGDNAFFCRSTAGDDADLKLGFADPAVAARVEAQQRAKEEELQAEARANEARAQAAAVAEEQRVARQESCSGIDLVIESWSWSDESGYVKATGQVTNVSDAPLDRVAVDVSYYTADGTFIKNGDALIDYQPVLAGQTSPFSTIDSGNPAMDNARIAVKDLLGGTYETMERKEYDLTCT